MDKLFITIIITICSSKVTSGALEKPIYLWPLNNRSMGYEILGAGIDGMHPTIDGCFRVSPFPYETEKNLPLFLDGTRESYIALNITDDNPFPSFGFFLAFYPHVTSGTILHYQSNAPTSTHISEIIIKLDQGDLLIDIKNGSGYSIVTFPVVTALSEKEWHHISLSYDQPTGELEIHSNFSLVSKLMIGIVDGLSLPGILRIGVGADINDLYVGAVRCLMMFDQGKGFDSRTRLINWYCITGWTYVPQNPTCFSSPTYPNVKLLWPFDEKAGADEVKTHSPPLMSTITRYQHAFTKLNGNKAIYFDGSKYTNIDLTTRKNLLQSDFSLAMMIFPNMFNGSGIFNIKNESSLAGLIEINVIVTPSGYIRVKITSGSNECLDFLVPLQLVKGEWHLLAVQRFSIAQQTSIILDGQEYTSPDTCVTSFQTDGDLVLNVGGDTNGADRYLGSIRCLGLFDAPLWPTTAHSTLLATCSEADVLSYNNTVDIVYEENPMVRTLKSKGHPNRAIRDGHLLPITTLLNLSKIRCARVCLETRYCRSFTVDDNTCEIFDFVTTEGLIEQISSFYYIRS